ncbi:MAG: cobalamin-dependent protein [Eubacterium sp.]
MKESIVRSIEGLYEQRTLELVKIAIRKGFPPVDILEWLQAGMERVGDHYEKCDYFIADLIFAGIIFQEVMGLDEFKVVNSAPNTPQIGKIVTASVYGDCHDIGKNIFASFAMTAGFEVTDLGVDVPTENIINKVMHLKPDIIGLSGMQQDTILEMKRIINGLLDLGVRNQFHIIIGGACIDDGITHLSVGADYATKDVTKAVEICKHWIQEK